MSDPVKNLLSRTPLGRVPLVHKIPAWGWPLLGLAALFGLLLVVGAAVPSLSPAAESPGGVWDMITLAISVLVKLGIVLGLIYVSLGLLRRWRGVMPGAARRQMTVLETQRLSPRQSLHLVQVGEKVILVGATDHTITCLTEVDLQPAAETGSQAVPASQSAIEPELTVSPAPAGVSFSSLFANRLKTDSTK